MLVRHDMTLADELAALETDFRRGAPLAAGVLAQPPQRRAAPARESATQRAIIARLATLGIVAAHVPNEGRRSRLGHARAVQDGLMTGFPDLVLIGTAGRTGFMEVKGPRGTLSDAQRARINMLHARGHLVAVVRDQDYAAHVVRQWGWCA